MADQIDTSDEECALVCMIVSNPGGGLRPPAWEKRVNDLIRALHDERNDYRARVCRAIYELSHADLRASGGLPNAGCVEAATFAIAQTLPDGSTPEERAERAEFDGFCRRAEETRDDPMGKAYWRLVRRLTVACVEAGKSERGGALDDGEVVYAEAVAVGAALMYAVAPERGGDHVKLADKLAPVVVKAMREAAAKLEGIEAEAMG